MARRQLLQNSPAIRPKTFADELHDALKLANDLDDASRPARCRLNAAGYVNAALSFASASLEQIEELDGVLMRLPQTPENTPVQQFVSYLTDLAADAFGTFTPPSGNFPYFRMGTTMSEVAAAATDLKVTRLELAAVAALRATKKAPHIFEHGCFDATKHEQMLKELREELESALLRAAHAWTLADLQFDKIMPGGNTKVSFALSDGEVGVSPPGDAQGMRNLVAYLQRKKEMTID